MVDFKNLDGLDKVAILFKTLGNNLALQLFKGMTKEQIQKVRQRMGTINNIPFAVKKTVLEEFYFSFISEKFTPATEETKKAL